MNLLGAFAGSSLPAEYKEPFNRDCITLITIKIGRESSIFRGGKKCSAEIQFKNGNTSGDQELFDDDFETLMLRVKDFCEKI